MSFENNSTDSDSQESSEQQTNTNITSAKAIHKPVFESYSEMSSQFEYTCFWVGKCHTTDKKRHFRCKIKGCNMIRSIVNGLTNITRHFEQYHQNIGMTKPYNEYIMRKQSENCRQVYEC